MFHNLYQNSNIQVLRHILIGTRHYIREVMSNELITPL